MSGSGVPTVMYSNDDNSLAVGMGLLYALSGLEIVRLSNARMGKPGLGTMPKFICK